MMSAKEARCEIYLCKGLKTEMKKTAVVIKIYKSRMFVCFTLLFKVLVFSMSGSDLTCKRQSQKTHEICTMRSLHVSLCLDLY